MIIIITIIIIIRVHETEKTNEMWNFRQVNLVLMCFFATKLDLKMNGTKTG